MNKLVIGILCGFFMFTALRARELTYKERMAVLSSKKHIELKSFFLEQIDPQTLPFKDYISYKVLKESCTPLQSTLKKVEESDSDLDDQSKKLRVLYEGCMEGTLGLGYLYQKHK